MRFSPNIVYAVASDRKNGKRRHGRYWLRDWGNYSSLDDPATSSQPLGHLPIFSSSPPWTPVTDSGRFFSKANQSPLAEDRVLEFQLSYEGVFRIVFVGRLINPFAVA